MFFSLRIALSSLATHKLRTLLAMLGVFLGALALTGVRHVSEAMTRKAEIETAKLGPNLLIAFAGKIRFRRGEVRINASHRNFRLNDAAALLDGLPDAAGVAPFITMARPIRAGAVKTVCQLVATWPDFVSVRNARPEYGRFFTEQEERRKAMVCVLGKTIAERLFTEPQNAVGKSVFIYKAKLRVVGVMEEKGRDIAGTNQDEQVFTPLSTFMRRLSNMNHVHGAFLQMRPGTDFEAVKETARLLLRSRHGLTDADGDEDDFKLLTPKDTKKLQTRALELVHTLGVISSSLSFAVGGLGILSIMVLLVRARRMEIGVRRAVGARRRDIVLQFLFESALMSAVGGAAGVLTALILLSLAYALADLPPTYDVLLVFQALAGSALLGVLAGAYPARQAAKVQVLDVLRDMS